MARATQVQPNESEAAKTAEAETDAVPGFSFASIQATEAPEALKPNARTPKPNPLRELFAQSYDARDDKGQGTTLTFSVPSEDLAKQAVSHLRRAADAVKSGLSIRKEAGDGDSWRVTFAAKKLTKRASTTS